MDKHIILYTAKILIDVAEEYNIVRVMYRIMHMSKIWNCSHKFRDLHCHVFESLIFI